jgi:DNA-binding CsgD family transcriptional regulator
VALWQDLGNQENLAECLSAIATLAAQSGARAWAASAFGAAEGLRVQLGHTIGLSERLIYEQTIDEVRAALGEPALAVAWERGYQLPLAQVMDEATAFLAGNLPTLRMEAPADRATPPLAAQFGLTAREQEVLALLAARLTNLEIAEQLSIGPRTIQSHVAHIFNKLGVAYRREAAAIAARHGLV